MTAFGKVTLRNYRCFDWNNPATLEFGNGFTAYVGPNNSGKSTALRSIYELRPLFQLIRNIVSGINVSTPLSGTTDPTELANINDTTKFQITIGVDCSNSIENETNWHATEILLEYDIKSTILTRCQIRVARGCETGEVNSTILKQVDTINPNRSIYRHGTIVVDYSMLVEFATELFESKYFPAFRNAINTGAGPYYDLSVGTAFIETWDEWKAGSIRERKNAIIRVEKEIAELLGFNKLQINADRNNKTLDVIIDEKPHKLYEVGAGVAQLIIVFAAALISNPPYILIDEPELSLHPALQLNFLSILGSYTKKGLLYATHSIGLARSSAERIYAVKIEGGLSKMHLFGETSVSLGQWLGELSYSNRVDLGCEGIILVEGPTDVLCFQEFLRKVKKDHKYVLIPLGGSSGIRSESVQQLSEFSRIINDTSKIRGFIDSEKSSTDTPLAEGRSKFVDECKKLGITVHVSERRATENYFELNGISKALGNGFQPLEPYQKLKEGQNPWQKSLNWKIARETDLADIKDTDLWKFLDTL